MARWQVIGGALVIAVVASSIKQISLLVAILFIGVALVAYTSYVNKRNKP